MAFSSSFSCFSKFILQTPGNLGSGFQQIRNKWCKALVRRDMKRRKAVKDYAEERMRLLALKRNTILPIELKYEVCKLWEERIPRITAQRQLTHRCVVTGRPRGVVHRWRLSRIVFRHLVDYNKLAGVQRAMW